MTDRRPTPDISLDDLRRLAGLEGKPLPRGQALADALGMRPSAAWEFIRRMKHAGVLQLVSPVQLKPDVCNCITDILIDATKPSEMVLLEKRIVDDPSVMAAVRVTGNYDYRLLSRHRDYRCANDWSRSLEACPCVTRVRTRICMMILDRNGLAGAILGSS